MKKMSAVVAVSVALCGLSVSTVATTAAQAARLRVTPVHAMFERTKMVKFSLRNDTGAPLELKVSETVMTLEVGKTVPMKLAVGTRICTNGETARHKSGDVLVEVASQLSDATIGIK